LLGHHKPSSTKDTYVHLFQEDIPDPTFLDGKTTAARSATGLVPIGSISYPGAAAVGCGNVSDRRRLLKSNSTEGGTHA